MRERASLEREIAFLLGREWAANRAQERELSAGAVGRLFASFASFVSARVPERVEDALKSSPSFRKHVATIESSFVLPEDAAGETLVKGVVTTGPFAGKRVLAIERVLDGTRFVPLEQDLSATVDAIKFRVPIAADPSDQAVEWLENIAGMAAAVAARVQFRNGSPRKTLQERIAKHIERELVVNEFANRVLREVEKKHPRKFAWKPFLIERGQFEIQMFAASEPLLTNLEHYVTLEAMLTAGANEKLIGDDALRGQRDQEADGADLPGDLLLPDLTDLSPLPAFTSAYGRHRFVRRLLHSRWRFHQINHHGGIFPLSPDAVKERQQHAKAFFPKGVAYWRRERATRERELAPFAVGTELEAPTPADRAGFAVIADRIKEDQKLTRGDNVPIFQRMQALADALLAEDKDRSRLAAKAVLEGKKWLPSSTENILAPIALQFVIRCYLLGLKDESKALRDYFASRDYLPVRSSPNPRFWAFEAIADHVRRRPAPTDSAGTRARLEFLARVFAELAADFAGPHKGPNAWESVLNGLVDEMFAAFEVMVQVVTRELQSGSTSSAASLSAARKTLRIVAERVLPRYEAVPLQREVTRSVLAPKPRHLDYFDPTRGPSIPIVPYSREDPSFSDKSLWLNRVLEIRAEQLDALEFIFGHVARLKAKLALHDNESWRAFALAVFKDARSAGKPAADKLALVVGVLGRYLRAFTLHTPMNIDDFGNLSVAAAMKENYLERQFPRAATGQRIHDCGVYAVRVAYILSGVQEVLGFSARAILLPAHVGLVITLGKLGTLAQLATGAIVLVNNADLERVTKPDEVAAEWTAGGRAYEETGFLAALAASRYIEGVPLPFRFAQVPALATRTPAGARRAALWKFYITNVTPRAVPLVLDVIRSAPAIREPWLNYLEVFDSERRDSNDGVVPFWKQARALWEGMDHGQWLSRAKDLLSPRYGPAGKEKFRKAVAPPWKDYWTLSQRWRETMEALADARTRMGTFMIDNPMALEQGARVTEGADALFLAGKYEVLFWQYLGELPSKADRVQKDTGIALGRAQTLAKSTLLTGADVTAPWRVLDPPEPMD